MKNKTTETKTIYAKKKLAKNKIQQMEIINGRHSFEFCKRVNGMIEEGWQPYGEVILVHDEFTIAMVK